MQRMNVQAVPTYFFIKDGNVVSELVGQAEESAMKQKIDQIFG